MIKWIPSKIGAKLLITFSAVLVLSMVSLIYVATQMVGEFGEFSASRNEANIRDNANAFMARITHEQAMRYESTFEKLALSSALIAKRATFFLENMTLYGKMPLKPNEKLVIYPHNGIFSNDRSERTMVLYWGSPAMSPGINEQINTLSHLDPLLETVKEGNPESVACYAVTESGISRYYPNIHGVEKLPPTTKFDIRNATWYVIAKPENNPERKTVWSNIYLDSVGQGLLTTASTPLYSKSGQYVGAAGIDITLDTIVKDILERIPSCHKMEGMFSFLVDNQGKIIAFPQEYLEMFGIKIDQDKLVDATVILKHSLLDSSNAEIKKIGKSMLEKKYQVSRLILNGQAYIISSHFMPSTEWRLGTVVPESVILASVQETRNALDSTVKSMATRFTLLTILFLIVSIIVMAILTIKSFIRPLGKLSKGALRVKKGDLTTHVDIDTKDEIGAVAQTFNNMVDTLREAKEREKEYTQVLEQKVRDRTQEIVIKNEDLEKTRERLELAMDAGEHGFWDWNLDTDDIYFSPRYYTMLGYEPDELPMKMKTWVDLMHPDDQKTIVPEVENYVKNARPYQVEFRLKTKDGDWKWISGRGKSYEKDSDGIPHRAVGVHVDISERKRGEEELRENEEKLARSKKMEAMGLMAGGVAHDLNNILSGLVSYPELLLMDLPEDSPLRKPIKTIQESGMRAADVVEDLLTIARGVATGKEVLNLNTLITEYLESAEHQKLKKIHPLTKFKTELDAELLNVTGSASHVKKILMNLIVNASEAIEGKGTVAVSTINRYLDEPLKGYEDVHRGEYVLLAISDDGSGISPQDLHRIFEPFYTKKVMGRSGTGLGLAVVWNSMQDHDGYINVKSSEKGTVFELYFPTTREQVADEKEDVPLEDYLGHGEKILVVDDEERQREIACGMLAKLGYHAEAVSSGEEAIEYMKENSVDMIVLDMVMPKGINGRETYQQIIKIRPGQKAVISSGYAKTKEVDLAQELGAGKYIKKPYMLEKIGVAVKEELEK